MARSILPLLLLMGPSAATGFLLPPTAASAAAAPPPPAAVVMQAARQPADSSNNGNRQGLSRSQLLSTLVFGGAAAALVGSAGAADAAVPTMQEYYGGEGAQARTNNYIVSGKARKAQQEKEEAAAQGAEKQQAPPSDPRALLGEVDKALTALTPLIKQELWDDVLAATKKRPLNALLTPYLGFGSVAALGQAAGKTAAQAKALEESRVEVGLTLQQLVDYAFSNRVIFFNALDKQQVAALAAQRPNPPDLSEPLGLLADTLSLTKGLVEQL